MTNATVEFRHVSKKYGPQGAVVDLSLLVPAGDICVLVGPSGCGKTTSLKMVNRLVEPSSGQVLIDGQDVMSVEVTALRRAEQKAMAAFGADGRCLMRVLQEELDDPAPADCGRCSVCAGPRYAGPLDSELVEAAGRHLRATPIELEVKKMAPDAEGVMRKIPEDVRLETVGRPISPDAST